MVYTLNQLKRLRLVVFIVAVLGISGSVTLNVLHAPNNTIAQVISGFPPVALAFAMELISRIPSSHRGLSIARISAATVIGGIGGSISYIAQMDTVRHYGIEGWQADVWPLIIDGLLVVILLSLIEVVRKIHQVDTGMTPLRRAVTKDERQFEDKARAFRDAQRLTAAQPLREKENFSPKFSENIGEKIGEKIG